MRKGRRAPARLALLSGTALVGATLCVAMSPTPALACSSEPCTWTGAGGNGSWSNSSNWSNGTPATSDSILLTNAGAAPANHDQSAAYNSITLNPNAAGYTINNSPVVLQSGGSITDNNTAAGSPGDTFNTGLTLNGPATITIAAGAAGLTFATNPITGAGSLFIQGSGTLTLTATGNNIGGDLDITACGCSVAKLKLMGGSFVVGGSTTV
ncbi:MAG: hypothetical protein JO134_09945, partial [Xanthobacteraceae bacterium]|nr:hypothetical protein [Xanthobacteraceae bacterium]